MKVTAWKNIDVDVEVDVSVDEILCAMGERVDEITASQLAIARMRSRHNDENAGESHGPSDCGFARRGTA